MLRVLLTNELPAGLYFVAVIRETPKSSKNITFRLSRCCRSESPPLFLHRLQVTDGKRGVQEIYRNVLQRPLVCFEGLGPKASVVSHDPLLG